MTDLVEQLLWQDESAAFDFKETQYPFADATREQKGEIVKDTLAFTNAFRREDAYVLLGVRDVPGGRATIIGVTNHGSGTARRLRVPSSSRVSTTSTRPSSSSTFSRTGMT